MNNIFLKIFNFYKQAFFFFCFFQVTSKLYKKTNVLVFLCVGKKNQIRILEPNIFFFRFKNWAFLLGKCHYTIEIKIDN